MSGTHGARLGAAVFALGISVVGPQAAVAVADGSDADSTITVRSSRAATHTPRVAAGRAGAGEGRAASGVGTAQPRPAARGTAAVRRTVPAARTHSGAVTLEPPTSSPRLPAAAPSSASAQPTAAPVAESESPVPPPRMMATGDVLPAASSAVGAGCSACWGMQAASLGQGITTSVNHLFNSAFTWLSEFPANPISDLVGGALVLIRRALFLVPDGVSASEAGNALTVTVNTGSVAYFRQDGTTVQVSGDPWFFAAQRFDDSSDIAVSVTNPGNAGCAGVVLSAGIVNGDLTTSQIDDIRFDVGAAFAGNVTLAGSALTVRNAVRGLGGVTFDAAVVLATDVEVDGGDGDVTFSDTVDASTSGEQSLTVTALGATTFAAGVGSHAALASLLTQGIAPLAVSDSGDTKTIALHYLPEYSTGSAQVKYGIDVAIGDNPSQLYEFDTGGVGFFAGYNPAFWSNVPLTSTAISETYSSGNYLNGVVADTRVTLGRGQHTVSTAVPIQVAAILDGGNSNTGAAFDFTDPDTPPIEDHFFGDFGASFATLPVNGLDTPLANPLFQLPGNLSSGFLVRLGPIGIDPQLTVGVTDDLRAQFTYAVPVTADPDGGTYPVSGYDVLSWFGFAPAYTATQGDDEQQIGLTPTLLSLIDSGAPSSSVRLKGQGGDPFNVDGRLEPGTTFTAVFPTTMGREPLEWTFVAGDNGSVNLVNYEQGDVASSIQNVNTGLDLYNAYDVMFDVADGVIWLRPTGAQATVVLGSVTTTGSQTYRQNAGLGGTYRTVGGDFWVAGVTTLRDDTVVDAGSGDVLFSGTVDSGAGAESFTVNSSGTTTFVRAVGGQKKLDSLVTDAGGSAQTAAVQTAGSQFYNDAVSLNGSYTVSSGTFLAGGSVTLTGPVAISGGDITLLGPIDSTPARGFALTLNPGDGNSALLAGDVGAADPLGGLTVQAVADGTATITAPGYLALAGDLGFSADKGLYIGDGVTASFTGGGVIRNFTDSGVVIEASVDSVIADFAISGNGRDGVQLNGATRAAVRANTILGNGGDGINAIDTTAGSFTSNSILANGGDGVLINGGTGNRILSNSVFGNGGTDGLGIRLSNGGNNDQPAPEIDALAFDEATLTLTLDLTVTARPDYSGNFTVEVFYSPASGATNIQGQQLVYQQQSVAAGSVQLAFAAPGSVAGGYLTVTATPRTGPTDTSAFSTGRLIPV